MTYGKIAAWITCIRTHIWPSKHIPEPQHVHWVIIKSVYQLLCIPALLFATAGASVHIQTVIARAAESLQESLQEIRFLR